MKIEHSIALVTGANRGVGQEYVRQLLEGGADRVYATARNMDSLEQTRSFDSRRVVPLALDVTKARDISAAVTAAQDVTLLINNAGVLSFGGALEVDHAAMAGDMAVNYTGLTDLTRAFAPTIEANGGGAVVNMLSLLSFLSAPGFAAYNASKAAAWSMAMSLRAYLAPKRIEVLNAFPAGIDTDMLAGVEADKDSAAAVVTDVLTGLEAGAQDVYPASASGVHAAWRADPKAVEQMFAAMM